MKTLADKNISCIVMHGRTPFCPDRGQHVRLTDTEKFTIRQIYDREPQGQNPLTGNLAGYVALLHLCGPEALGDEPLPMVEVDPWTVWHSAGVTLHPVLKREGDIIVYRKLGTRYPVAAA